MIDLRSPQTLPISSLAMSVVSFTARQPKSVIFSGWPSAQEVLVPTTSWCPSSVPAVT